MDNTSETSSVSKTVAPDLIGFFKLPTEIRVRIWELVANQPRNLDIWHRRLGYFEEERSRFACQVTHWVTLSAVPPILHVSQESRAVGLKFYQLDFGVTIRPYHGMKITNEPRIYVNWDADRIVVLQTNKQGYGAFSEMINSNQRLVGTRLNKVAIRVDHRDPGLSRSLGRSFNEILIYYDPFLFYDRLKSRNLTIEFEPIVGIDLICNKEKEELEYYIECLEKNEIRNDEEFTQALAEGTPIPPQLKNHVVGSWVKPTVQLGRMVVYGRMSGTGSGNETWTHAGWVPLSSVDTITK